jgi:outer membrane receptor for ferrienterochelin and colicins
MKDGWVSDFVTHPLTFRPRPIQMASELRELLIHFLLIALVGFAGFVRCEDAAETLEPIRVEDMREKLERAGKLKDSINKTEVINDKKIERKQAKTLTEAVANEPGIDAASGCSICGMKRIQINGLRGEYTTILVDDVPLHSTVSSYYGMDAATTAGIARIEIARGAGASLLVPGALGGVINIVSQKATENGFFFDVAGGNYDYRLLSIVGNAVSKNGKRRTTVSAQTNSQGQWDVDSNGVNESPRLGNYSLGLRSSDDLSSADNVDARLNVQRSDVFGGPVTDSTFTAIGPSGVASFVDGDVRKAYNGAPSQTLETVATQRLEGVGKWTHRFGEKANSVVTLSGVKQTQDSYYEGSDYSNFNETFYADSKLNLSLDERNLLTVGLDARHEILRSQSYAYFVAPSDPPGTDSFNFMSAGAYAQNTWTRSETFELSTVLRLDRVAVDWLGQTDKGNEVDQFVLVPRLHLRWNLSPQWVSRFSLGQGYRAPLTFFESEHGILNDGFNVLVNQLERSNSAVYSLSFDNKRTTATFSAAWTGIENMAYVDLSRTPRPALLTAPGKYDVFAADGVVGYQLTESLTVGASFEKFFYSRGYQALLPFAAIENRARLLVDVEAGDWDLNLTATLVGARDLNPYGYGSGRFNVFSGSVLSVPKLAAAPPFVTMDARVAWQANKEVKVYAGVRNLTGFTQAKVENALFYNQDGEYEVTHLWGPLRGREFFVGLSAKL